ncbi:MAG: glycosyltransferase [Elusimicrobiota bacterium]
MKTAILIDFLTQRGGAEWTLEVMHSIFPDSKIFTLFYLPEETPAYFKKLKIETPAIVNYLPFVKNHWRKYFLLYPYLIEKMDFSGFDLLISISFLFAKSAMVPQGTRHLCYILTPMRQIWDPKYIEYSSIPEFLINKIRKWDVKTSERPNKYVAISKTVAQRVKERYNRDCQIIYPPVDDTFFTPGCSPSDSYFLLVSRLVPYKRVDVAIEAFNSLGLPLKIIGKGRQEKELKSTAKKNIEFLGEVTKEELKELYQNCTALVFPQEEDFGITSIEAQLCGKPVIAYKKGGAIETVAEDKSGIFFEEQTSDSLKEAVKRIETKNFNSKEISENAKKFGIERFKRDFLILLTTDKLFY